MHLSDNDHTDVYYKLVGHAAEWREIGKALGFSEGEMDKIQSNPLLLAKAPSSYLGKMLSLWLQWAPGDERGSKVKAMPWVDLLKIFND